MKHKVQDLHTLLGNEDNRPNVIQTLDEWPEIFLKKGKKKQRSETGFLN